MRHILLPLCLLSSAIGQVVPAQPSTFKSRPVGAGSSSTGLQAAPKPPAQIVTVTYLTLSPARQFTSSEGKPLLAKLIAWEDFTVSGSGGAPQLAAPPTVVKDGKARLLVGRQPFAIALERLAPQDREFVEKVRVAAAAQPVPVAKAQ
jgi:hypothetical protein